MKVSTGRSYKRVGLFALSLVFIVSCLGAAVPLLSKKADALFSSVTPSTNATNKTNGWAHVDQVTKGVGSTNLQFISTRGFYSCFEYRTDGDSTQVLLENGGVSYNPLVADGLYLYTCSNNSSVTKTITAKEYVEVRMVFGAENDERFDWTRFDVDKPTTPPSIENLSITNDFWGPGYNILSKSNHLSSLSGLPVIGGTVKVAADFTDDKTLTNIQSYLPGKGFFSDNEYTPYPTNNASWNPMTQGNYSVRWDTKNGLDWRAVSDGDYNFTFLAKDMDGGQNGVQNTTTKSIPLTVDNTSATGMFSGSTPKLGTIVSGIINVEADFQDVNGLMNTMLGVHGIKWVCQTNWPSNGKLVCPIDTRDFPDGPQKLVLGAMDKAGNQTWESRDIIIDNAAPTGLANSYPNDGTITTTTGLAHIDWTDAVDSISNPAVYYYESSTSPTPNPDGSFASPAYQSGALINSEIPTLGTLEGVYYWHVRAVDNIGNSTSWTSPWVVTVDNTVPNIALIGGDMKLDQGQVFVEPGFDADDDSKVTVTGEVNTSKPGIYTLTYVATDGAGNTTTTTRTVEVVAPKENAVVNTVGNPSTPARTVALADNTPVSTTTTTNTGGGVVADTTGQVLGDQTSKANTNDKGIVKGDSTTKNNDNTWSFLGLAWYWWLLILAAVASAWWAFSAIRNRRDI